MLKQDLFQRIMKSLVAGRLAYQDQLPDFLRLCATSTVVEWLPGQLAKRICEFITTAPPGCWPITMVIQTVSAQRQGEQFLLMVENLALFPQQIGGQCRTAIMNREDELLWAVVADFLLLPIATNAVC